MILQSMSIWLKKAQSTAACAQSNVFAGFNISLAPTWQVYIFLVQSDYKKAFLTLMMCIWQLIAGGGTASSTTATSTAVSSASIPTAQAGMPAGAPPFMSPFMMMPMPFSKYIGFGFFCNIYKFQHLYGIMCRGIKYWVLVWISTKEFVLPVF